MDKAGVISTIYRYNYLVWIRIVNIYTALNVIMHAHYFVHHDTSQYILEHQGDYGTNAVHL